jgi:hypothetical protein
MYLENKEFYLFILISSRSFEAQLSNDIPIEIGDEANFNKKKS